MLTGKEQFKHNIQLGIGYIQSENKRDISSFLFEIRKYLEENEIYFENIKFILIVPKQYLIH